jgi:hypothetical protein
VNNGNNDGNNQRHNFMLIHLKPDVGARY